MADSFDLVVIGAGPGGYVAAIRAAQLDMKTVIIEREELGGVCLNWGCIPTKALLKSAEVFESLGHLKDYGLAAERAAFDFAAVVQRSRKAAQQLSGGVAFLMKKNKIEVVKGTARLERGGAAPA
ncbi:MAG: FAD-dependent oxidoreductase, partial [Caulobacteraceae bacterium]